MTKKINLTKNKEYFYILGVLLGDGNILHDRIRIAVKDKDFILKCQKCIQSCFKEKCKIRKRDNHGFCSKLKTSYLYHLNFCSTIASKIIQQDIKELSKLKDKEKFTAFLEGIYDSEGCVDKDRMRIRLIMRNFSIKTIKLISIFLTYLKINFQIRLFKAKGRFGIRKWLIVDIDEANSLKFHQNMQFSIKRKRERLENHCKTYQKKWLDEAIKREETKTLKEEEWCKKYDLTRNQYYRHKRLLKL